ncbi:MAG: tRNA (guanosine(46)-N7)-methyltransferase TrmB [Gammaproteobacteria bacterium]|nr:tRNA (guanosine(46)-N7)-methyltransferase TrmB [Gammaproteobacteria bacterium]
MGVGGTGDLTQPGRKIRSFVRREGRMTAAQQSALDELWPRWGIPLHAALKDVFSAFDDCGLPPQQHCQRIMEIGFGMGDSLFAQAKADSESCFLGVEPHRPGVGHLLNLIDGEGIGNLRLVCGDALDVLEHHLPVESLHKLQVFFPDPWPKKRHHKRRLVNPAFVRLAASRLCSGGVLHLATDWHPYAEYMLETLSQMTETLVPCEPPLRIKTKYEARGERLGHAIQELAFQKI